MNVLQVNTYDRGGGAEMIATQLRQACTEHGYGATMAVGDRFTQDEAVRAIPRQMPNHAWYRFWTAAAACCDPFVGTLKGAGWLRQQFFGAAQPTRWMAHQRGFDDFHHPGTRELMELFDHRPDLVHCHNLHGPYNTNFMRAGYFDLRVLPWLCRQVPVVLTLHDAWLLSGHCAHSFNCPRWRTGCGKCPDLSIYPAIARDTTARNWTRKRDIFAQCRLYIATPSQWLMDKVQQSILAQGIVEARVISNGVNLAIFHPGDHDAARHRLGLPRDALILLASATDLKNNPWKDYATLEKAVEQVAGRDLQRPIILLVLGHLAPTERRGHLEKRYVRFVEDRAEIASYYQASDIVIHAAKADTFPTTVIEALACGTPVVATAVGGIPEQIVHGKNGLLVPIGNVAALLHAIQTLADNAELRRAMGAAAAENAALRFDERAMISAYCGWYEEIHERQRTASPSE